jgi:hypothetical protein
MPTLRSLVPLRFARRPVMFGALALWLALPGRAAAQEPASRERPDSPAPDECFGISFGPWDPPLDWSAAGHSAATPPATAPAPGRGDAIHSDLSDSTLLLFPSWWPAGVVVRFPRQLASADTVDAVAIAMVADGQIRAPKSHVQVRRVPCHRPPAVSSDSAPPGRAMRERTWRSG